MRPHKQNRYQNRRYYPNPNQRFHGGRQHAHPADASAAAKSAPEAATSEPQSAEDANSPSETKSSDAEVVPESTAAAVPKTPVNEEISELQTPKATVEPAEESA
jgi:hypothetical protein